MPTLQELRDQRANTWAQAQEFNERHQAGETMSAEDETAWNRSLNEVDRLGTQIENRERNEALENRFNEIDEQTNRGGNGGRPSDGTGGDGASLDDYRAAFVQFVRYGMHDMPAEQRQLLQAHVVESRQQGIATGAIGGFTVPEGFWQKVTETLLYFASVAPISEQLNTSMGNKIPWPTNDDTANEGELLDENTPITQQDMTFGQAVIDAYMYTSKLVLVSYQLLQDTGIDLEAWLARKLGERLGRIVNRHYTVGTGVDQPQGYTAGATQGATSSLAGADEFNDPQNAWLKVVDLIHSVDVAYRDAARFTLHDLVLAQVRKWRDADGRPLWIPSTAAGVPDTIMSYPYLVNNYQDSVSGTAGDIPLFFGNFMAGFVTRTVTGGLLKRLEERYADNLQVGFFAFSRHDSVVQDPSAIKYLEIVA